jgi:hypothetical protein
METQRVSLGGGQDGEGMVTDCAESAGADGSFRLDTENRTDSGSSEASGLDPEKARQFAEQLEKMVELNLENGGLGSSRFSRPMLQLASALAGLATLFLMYCCTRLMY